MEAMLFLYLDESGDLGFDFVNKKPSKFFVVTILAVQGQDVNRRLINAVRKTIKRKLNPRGRRSRIVQELKGTGTTLEIKKYFHEQAKLIDLKLYSIILNEKRVFDSLVRNKPRVYNYVCRLLLDKVSFEDASIKVDLIIDKSKSKPEILDFNRYVTAQLEARINPNVPLYINHRDSQETYGLQAVDMFCHGFFEAYERRRWEWYNTFEEKVVFRTVYLPDK